jgi:hypothetical protein
VSDERIYMTNVQTGRNIEVVGEVVTDYDKTNRYGTRRVMIVELDNGTKLWGSVPSSLATYERINYNTAAAEAAAAVYGGTTRAIRLHGQTVRFTAEVTASDTDPNFGFFKRPKNAESLGMAEAS